MNKSSFTLSDVKNVYSGPEKNLWELMMGEQIHIGGLSSTMDLAEAAGIESGSQGVDLCCCTGAGMKVLLRFMDVAHMTGVDATPEIIAEANERAQIENMDAQLSFAVADACKTKFADNAFDFVWGEDAWVYVEDKTALITEAIRIVKKDGTIAFTDWVEGPTPMTQDEAERFFNFMKFPNIQTLDGYAQLLEDQGCEVTVADYTGNFVNCIELYMAMLGMQLTYDALKILDFNSETMSFIMAEMNFIYELAEAGKIKQAIIVATK